MASGEQIRNGIFSLYTRRFGSVAEIMIQKLLAFKKGLNQFHDLYDPHQALRVEVKFSRGQRKEDSINEENVLQVLENVSDFTSRMFPSTEWHKNKFDCNIQQVKPSEFDLLYYGVFFSDVVVIFKLTPDDLTKAINYSNKQHKGNVGEGQFHLNNKTYEFHLENFFDQKLTYEELGEILKFHSDEESNVKIVHSGK
ncbi:hypothetical protein GCM10008967_17770 [Bacillus carboniphilus]|uniref:Uncharacterized protein n=1 Tax=Bacillus carboniphilus TaxID=86663 RepID=A0ABN0W7A5_9BACI